MSSTLEPKWKTYLKAAVLAAPALFIWVAANVFVFPKVKQIWVDTGLDLGFAHNALHASGFFVDHALLLSAVMIVGLVLLEWRTSIWARYRRGVFSLAIFCLNTGVLVLMSSIVISLVMVIPSLLQRQ